MNDPAEAKERYRLLLTGEPDDEFREELTKQAADGGVSVTAVSPSEVSLEGENSSLAKLFVWLLGAHLEKVQYLKTEQ